MSSLNSLTTPWHPGTPWISRPGLTTPSHADLLRISFVKHWDSVPRMSGRGKTWEPVGCWMLKVKVDEGCSTVEVKHRRNHSFFFNGWELGVVVCGGTCQIKTGCGS